MSDTEVTADESDNDEVEQEEEAIEDLFLRHKFQNHAFPWKILNEAGWVYRSDSGYEAPTGRSFKTGKEVEEFLDHHAIPDVFSNLQSIAKTEHEATEEQQQLRRDLIKLMYKQKISRKSLQETNEGNNDAKSISSSSRMSVSVNSPKVAANARRSSGRTPAHDVWAITSTVADKGTEMYLNKSSKRTKKSFTYQPLHTDEPITLPSIDKCRQMSRDHPVAELDDIQSELEQKFDEWRFLLTTNHNLLFFGAGSKRNLLESFGRKSLSDEGYVLIIDGFAKEVSVEAILDLFVKLFLDDEEPEPCDAVPQDDGKVPVVGISNPWRAHPLVERAITISRAIAYNAMETLEPIFLIVHNIEGESLRTDVSQEALAALFVNSRVANGTAAIRLVASIDDVDCSYKLWRLPVKANFSWLWKEVHTYRPYYEEFEMLEAEDTKEKAKAKVKAVKKDVLVETKKARVIELLNSLAPKHAEVLQILAQLQLNQMTVDKEKCWVEYATFRDLCKKKYVVTKEQQLLPLLDELNDHNLVQAKKTRARIDEINIPHGHETLKKIIAYDIKSRPT